MMDDEHGVATQAPGPSSSKIADLRKKLLKLHDELAEVKVLFSESSPEESQLIMERLTQNDAKRKAQNFASSAPAFPHNVHIRTTEDLSVPRLSARVYR
jgi:hypothetical protein